MIAYYLAGCVVGLGAALLPHPDEQTLYAGVCWSVAGVVGGWSVGMLVIEGICYAYGGL